MKIAVVGCRDSYGMNIQKMAQYIPAPCTQIISGGAEGIDLLAKQYALRHDIAYREFAPDYKLFGRQAPLVRNTQIVQAADKVLAFWDFSSRGTAHTISECIRLKVPVQIISLLDE